MNYTLRKPNCKALIIAIFSIVSMVLFSTRAYAAYSMRLCPNFLFDNKAVYVAENVSPRASSLTSVTVGYDNLSDLVYYCNEYGLSTTLAYNTALGVYVGYVNDDVVDVKTFGVSSLHGLLGNSAGKVYVAKKEASGGDTVNNNTYNFNQTIINNHNAGSGGTVSNPYVSSSWTDRAVQEKIYQSVDTIRQMVSITNGYLSNLGWINIDIRNTIQQNVVPAIEAVNKNLISFKDSTVAGLQNLHSDLTFTSDVLLTQLNTQNRIYSSVTGLGSRLDTLVANSAGIGSRLDSIINNGAVQVNTSSIDARLDKLISMYSKVNSVVLDTAAINGSKIKAAVGGELQDAIFWGVSSFSDKKFIVSDGTFTLNGGRYQIPVQPLGFTTGASVPASFNTTDTALMAGVWRTSGGSYCLSDTYNAATGEYVRRVGVVTYDGSEDWKMVAKDGCYLFYLSDPAFSHTNGNIFSMSSHFGYVPYNSAFSGNASDSAIAYNYKCTVFTGKIMVITQSPSVAAWKTWLKQQADAGTPWTVWYQDKSTTTVLDRTTIAIPEGDGIITGDYMRITGKYETYDSYTQTADIIAAINNIPPYDDTAVVGAITKLENALSKPSATVTADLTEVTVRLDTLIENSASKVENVTVNITEDNDAFNVFYITGEDGETQPVTEFAKNLSGASGKFLSVLYRLVFSDALNSADSDLGSLEDFFTSTEPEESTVTQSADSTHGEVDIWSAF